MVVFWRVPARTIAKKYSKYKAFPYIEVQAACCVLLFRVVGVQMGLYCDVLISC